MQAHGVMPRVANRISSLQRGVAGIRRNDLSNRSLIRIHGGRQEGVPKPKLLRTSGCIRVLDSDAKILYDWWVEYNKANPKVKPGKLKVI